MPQVICVGPSNCGWVGPSNTASKSLHLRISYNTVSWVLVSYWYLFINKKNWTETEIHNVQWPSPLTSLLVNLVSLCVYMFGHVSLCMYIMYISQKRQEANLNCFRGRRQQLTVNTSSQSLSQCISMRTFHLILHLLLQYLQFTLQLLDTIQSRVAGTLTKVDNWIIVSNWCPEDILCIGDRQCRARNACP